MSDINAALKMEAEAMQRMKRNKNMQESLLLSGTSNRNYHNDNNQATFQVSTQPDKANTMDLMSFNNNELSKTVESSWTVFESSKTTEPANNNLNQDYNKTKDNVLSLYNSKPRSESPFSLQSQHPQSSYYYQPNQQSQTWQTLQSSSFYQQQSQTLPNYQQSTNLYSRDSSSRKSLPAGSNTMYYPVPSISKPASNTASFNTLPNVNMFTPTMPRPSSWGNLNENNLATDYVSQKSLHRNISLGNISPSFPTQDGLKSKSNPNSPERKVDVEAMNNIFDSWLKEENTVTEGSQSNNNDNFFSSDDDKAQTNPDWFEWDPLSSTSNASTPTDTKGQFTHFSRASSKKSDSDNNNLKLLLGNQSSNEESSVEESLSELERFVHMVALLRGGFDEKDALCNPGHVVSLMNNSEDHLNNEEDMSVRISVRADGIEQAVTFECDVNASVEHIVSQALCIAYEDISIINLADYFFKITGKQEYLISKTRLGLYQYVQECCKYDQELQLELVHKSKVNRSLRRNADDNSKATLYKDFFEIVKKPATVISRKDVQVLVEAFYKEAENLLNEIKSTAHPQILQHNLERVIQSVKAACFSMNNLELCTLTDKLNLLKLAVTKPNINTQPDKLLEVTIATDDITIKLDDVRRSLEEVTSSLLDMSELYCKAYQVDAYSPTLAVARSSSSTNCFVNSVDVSDHFGVNIMSAHRIPKAWETMYVEYYVASSLWYGDCKLGHKGIATKAVKISTSFFPRLAWKSRLTFDVKIQDLPLEAALRLILFGTIVTSDEKMTSKRLGWLNIPLFHHNRLMRNGEEIFGMWTFKDSKTPFRGPLNCDCDITNQESIVLHVSFEQDKPVKFSDTAKLTEKSCFSRQDITTLDVQTQTDLKHALKRATLSACPLTELTEKDKSILWRYRDIVSAPNRNGRPGINLSTLLECVPNWSPSTSNPSSAYQLLRCWPVRPRPEESLSLLTSKYPDSVLRSTATQWLEAGSDVDIFSWLPQIVQALRSEQRHDSPLARLLLRRALGNITILHKLYWLLLENMDDLLFGRRFSLMHAAIVASCGTAMKREFDKESYFLKQIHRTAESVKGAKDSMKSQVLNDLIGKVSTKIKESVFRVPTNPAIVVQDLNAKNCSFFSSNAVPIKISLKNVEHGFEDVLIMYKVGDDLRQDALTMQLIRVMEQMWINEGLDLKMVTFDCLPTGNKQGFVEIIPDSKTFREIQSSYGLTGAFKDRPIAEWLQKHNPTGLSYGKAVENFTLSCAGYCVATYVLGICDRHNDNIMLKKTGHLFHIDFARFLGHAQMFGNIKRDRAPFVLTSDMAYVINGGDKPSSQFHDFVDICCKAFNIVRKQSNVIIDLLSLMMQCGIPELSGKSDLKYVYDALKPHASDTEATTMFTRLIESSLSSSFTRLNFFIHNLAQMRFSHSSSEEEKSSLSFAPQLRPYREEDGLITSVTVFGYQKRYNPEKYYMYCVKVTKERFSTSNDTYVFRTFDEFEELHRKLSYVFSSSQLPNFSNSVVVGRSQVKQVAERRKSKLNSYLVALLRSSRPVAMHNLVYTFFHAILRDEEKQIKPSLKSPDLTVKGEAKISFHYKNGAFYIMIRHCKNLSPVNGHDPDPYVKTYLNPDPAHSSKRKTKVVRKTLHPTYNEMLVYNFSLKTIQSSELHLSVWNYEQLQENDFMGKAVITLSDYDLMTETTDWFKLKSSSFLK